MFVLTITSAQSQIADIQQKNSYVQIYNDNNKKISAIQLQTNEIVKCFTSTFFVTQRGAYIVTYDENCKKISGIVLGDNDEVTSASGNTFNVKRRGSTYTVMYDMYCNKVNSRN